MVTPLVLAFAAFAAFATAAHGSISILFDYTYDGGFFSGVNSDRRSLLEAAANVFVSRLTKATFDPIVPSGTNHWTLEMMNPTTDAVLQFSDPVLAADTLKIQVGAQDLPEGTLAATSAAGWSAIGDNAWLQLIRSKNSRTRFEPIGGSISFDTETSWYFDPAPLTLENFTGKYDFFSVAQHELGHALGFFDGSQAFAANTLNGTYIGANATALYGGPIPLAEDGSHWAGSVTFQGAYAAMNPEIPMNTRRMFASVDFAALKDLGYNTSPAKGTLNVTVSDPPHGTVSKAFAGATTHAIGRQFVIRAIPRNGYLFAGWSGDLVSNANPLYFVMADGMTLQASFVPSPFINCQGRFYGIFASTGVETNGRWSLASDAYGAFTGSLVIDGVRRAISGRVDAQGHWARTFSDGSAIEFNQDLSDGSIAGTIAINSATALFAGAKLPRYSFNNPAPAAGLYTAIFQPGDASLVPAPPQGTGFTTLRITVGGIARLVGQLADGTAFALSVPLSDENKIGVSARFRRDFLHGTLRFPRDQTVTDLEGTLSWSRWPGATPKSQWFTEFDTSVSILASRWKTPARGRRVLAMMDGNNGVAQVTLGTGESAIQTSILVSAQNRVVENPPLHALAIKAVPANGLFRGSYLDSNLSRRSIRGVFLQKQTVGCGYFIDGDVTITPVE